MSEASNLSCAKDWHHLIERAGEDRCDLDILLKDEMEDKVTVRDDPPATTPFKEQVVVLGGQSYTALTESCSTTIACRLDRLL